MADYPRWVRGWRWGRLQVGYRVWVNDPGLAKGKVGDRWVFQPWVVWDRPPKRKEKEGHVL